MSERLVVWCCVYLRDISLVRVFNWAQKRACLLPLLFRCNFIYWGARRQEPLNSSEKTVRAAIGDADSRVFFTCWVLLLEDGILALMDNHESA